MADTIGLSDVSSKDTGKGKVLKTGNLKRSYNMPKGGKLSYKSITACFSSAKTDSDRVACKKHFAKKTKEPTKESYDQWLERKESAHYESEKKKEREGPGYVAPGSVSTGRAAGRFIGQVSSRKKKKKGK